MIKHCTSRIRLSRCHADLIKQTGVCFNWIMKLWCLMLVSVLFLPSLFLCGSSCLSFLSTALSRFFGWFGIPHSGFVCIPCSLFKLKQILVAFSPLILWDFVYLSVDVLLHPCNNCCSILCCCLDQRLKKKKIDTEQWIMLCHPHCRDPIRNMAGQLICVTVWKIRSHVSIDVVHAIYKNEFYTYKSYSKVCRRIKVCLRTFQKCSTYFS